MSFMAQMYFGLRGRMMRSIKRRADIYQQRVFMQPIVLADAFFKNFRVCLAEPSLYHYGKG